MHQYAKVLRDMSEPLTAGKGEAMAYGSIGSSGDGNCRVNADWLKDTIDQRAELLAACKLAQVQLRACNEHFAETGQGTEELFRLNGGAFCACYNAAEKAEGADND